MREILFRGKRKDNGGWAIAHNIVTAKSENKDIRRVFIVPKGEFIDDAITKTGILILVMPQVEVYPETVGQYTGLTDKNGKKIFEGDIVEFYFFDKGHKNTKTMCIEWRDSGFCMRELFRDYRLADDFSIITEKIFTYRGDIRNGVYTSNNTYFVEVIGNIHDNPELMKGGEG